MADSDEARNDIHEEAERVRDIYSSGLGWLLDNAKIISGALADEYFLGDCSVDERDYWLYLAQEFQPDIKIDNRPILRGAIFIAGFVTPSIDDVWRYVSKKASKEMIETIGEKESKKFLKSMTKFAGKAGRNGIKKLEGKGIKGFMYEVKVISKSGAYRLLGNKAKTGEIIWEVFEKTHH
ncbi:hypothetical protein SDC9_83952 [bioreactor metagenome]|uniref:Uncharacterized protein n=1 Tax=bioreactor metagenome TaxID=1076179 RepID=A0A644Z947_9ZZZZ